MPPLPPPRPGASLEVKGRPLTFSFFPVRRRNRRYGLNDVVFAVDPWAITEGAVNDLVSGVKREESLAFVAQARAFFAAASGQTPASPLLTYYAFLNLGKAIIRCRGFSGSLDRARHGLSDQAAAASPSALGGTLTVDDTGAHVNVFPELVVRLGHPRPANGAIVPVAELAAQVVVGHRLWREATNRSERFVLIEHVEFVNDTTARRLWLRLWLRRGDLRRYNLTHARVLNEGGLAGLFQEVNASALKVDPDLLCLEQIIPIAYTGRPTDVVLSGVDPTRAWLWRIITASPDDGYRRYYLHLTPPSETSRQPQIASLWMLIFFFGSVVRYRPQAFATMTRGRL